jgi:hypothetical protein
LWFNKSWKEASTYVFVIWRHSVFEMSRVE